MFVRLTMGVTIVGQTSGADVTNIKHTLWEKAVRLNTPHLFTRLCSPTLGPVVMSRQTSTVFNHVTCSQFKKNNNLRRWPRRMSSLHFGAVGPQTPLQAGRQRFHLTWVQAPGSRHTDEYELFWLCWAGISVLDDDFCHASSEML